MHWIRREGRIKINSSFWLGWFTVRYYSLWETFWEQVCVWWGEWDREGIRLNFDMSVWEASFVPITRHLILLILPFEVVTGIAFSTVSSLHSSSSPYGNPSSLHLRGVGESTDEFGVVTKRQDSVERGWTGMCVCCVRTRGLSLSHIWLFAAPWTSAHQAPLGACSSMGPPSQKYWSGLPFPAPGDLPDPGVKPTSPPLAEGFFVTEPPETVT